MGFPDKPDDPFLELPETWEGYSAWSWHWPVNAIKPRIDPRTGIVTGEQGDFTLGAHVDDVAVDAMSNAMKAKLARQREMGYSGWDSAECTQQRLSDMLHDCVLKGDPVDVANFCAFLNWRGEHIVTWFDPIKDFRADQWWVKELDAMAGTPDQKRAVATVHSMLRAIAVSTGQPVDEAIYGNEAVPNNDAEMRAQEFGQPTGEPLDNGRLVDDDVDWVYPRGVLNAEEVKSMDKEGRIPVKRKPPAESLNAPAVVIEDWPTEQEPDGHAVDPADLVTLDPACVLPAENTTTEFPGL